MRENVNKGVIQHPRQRCYFCGSEGPIESHHIIPRRYNGTDQNKNLVDLCPTCHERLERLYDGRFYSQLDVEVGDETSNEPVNLTTQDWKSIYEIVEEYDGSKQSTIERKLCDIEKVEPRKAADILLDLKERGDVYKSAQGKIHKT